MNLKDMTPSELGETVNAKAIPYLIRYLQRGIESEKRSAASAISKLTASHKQSCELAVPALLTCLTDVKYPTTRRSVLKALLPFRLPPASLRLIRTVLDSDDTEYNRNASRRILANADSQSVKQKESGTSTTLNLNKKRSGVSEKQVLNDQISRPIGQSRTIPKILKKGSIEFRTDEKGCRYRKDTGEMVHTSAEPSEPRTAKLTESKKALTLAVDIAVPHHHAHRRVYHITNISNLAGILEHGLLSTQEREKRGLRHDAIANIEIQDRRSEMQVPCGPGGVVHDYVPLYFCKRSPMLYAIVYGKIADEQDLIYLEFPITIAEQYQSVFTDAAANTKKKPAFFVSPGDLDKVDWAAVNSLKWAKQHDKPGERPVKQSKMAELLVHRAIDAQDITRLIVWGTAARKRVQSLYDNLGIKAPAIVIGDYQYYFYESGGTYNGRTPPVTGPRGIRNAYDRLIARLKSSLRIRPAARYKTLAVLLESLRNDFGSLPETAEIQGLESDNEMHAEDVGQHSLRVVRELLSSIHYRAMGRDDRLLVELSAFLHDIGKGPKSRWKQFAGRQQVDPDHPLKALPMLERILTVEVAEVSLESTKLLGKLVCYHDLIGDIIGRGRRLEELQSVVESERELNLLIALGRADIKSVQERWLNEKLIDQLRDRVLSSL